jgi:hypothetical protein
MLRRVAGSKPASLECFVRTLCEHGVGDDASRCRALVGVVERLVERRCAASNEALASTLSALASKARALGDDASLGVLLARTLAMARGNDIDQSAWVRSAALGSLADMLPSLSDARAASVVDVLGASLCLDDAADVVRRAALDALTHWLRAQPATLRRLDLLLSAPIRQALAALVDDDDWEVKARFVRLLGCLSAAGFDEIGARKWLIALAHGDYDRVSRKAACDLLLEQSSGDDDDDDEKLRALAASLRTDAMFGTAHGEAYSVATSQDNGQLDRDCF